MNVPAGASAEVSWTVDASAALDVAAVRWITVTARTAHGQTAAPLALPMIIEGSLQRHLARYAEKRPLPIGELSRWEQNIAGHGKMVPSAPEGHFQMDVSFMRPGGAWVYPRFTLPEPLRATDTGVLLRPRVVKPGRNVAMYLNAEGKENFLAMDLFPGDGAWHVVAVPWAEFHPAPGHPDMQNARLDPTRVRKIQVGFGSSVTVNTMEISDLLVVGPPAGQ